MSWNFAMEKFAKEREFIILTALIYKSICTGALHLFN